MLTLLLLLPLALATATPKRCTTPSDTRPWILSNITAFYSTTPNTTAFTFHFTDPNAGLELDTDCACHFNTTTASGRYYGCEAGEVEFAVSSGTGTETVEVQRGYGDACQPAPYNEVKAVGMASLNLTRVTTAEGTVVGRQAELEMEITEMA
ncbi:hypothetical protein Tdes44962_MAKER07853 [Teratosphaeria destructans]|uniref:AA1-like domain-containing protein n=1 Tax=Teratosphaeria destructans TaxID=418781 RepID=A0A9W7W5G2_9PEZI|nr:hypothetical protein Tdes44962_MAKER07853 [Teratosphaeria destructans]